MTKLISTRTLCLLFFVFITACGSSSRSSANPDLTPTGGVSGSGGQGGMGGAGGSSGIGGAGGSGGMTAAELQICHDREKLSIDWHGDHITSSTDPYLREISFLFDPFSRFSAVLSATSSLSGTYEITESGKIQLDSEGTSQDATYQLTGDALVVTLANGQSYRLQSYPDHEDVFGYVSERLNNPYLTDGRCASDELPLPDFDTTSCSQEIIHGTWYTVFPPREGDYAVNKLAFSENPSDIGGGTPGLKLSSTTPMPRFSWGYLDVSLSSTVDPFGERSKEVSGNTQFEGDQLTLTTTSASLPGATIGTVKSYTLTHKPPFLILKSSDNTETIFGRKMSRDDDIDSQLHKDGICDASFLTTCPLTTMIGTWDLGSYYKFLQGDRPVIFSNQMSIPAFDRIIFKADGTLQVFRNGTAGESLFYHVVRCRGCYDHDDWALQVARNSSDFPAEVSFSQAAPYEGLRVSNNSLHLYFSRTHPGEYSGDSRYSNPLVFTKTSSSNDSVSMDCLIDPVYRN